ncbi:MAG: hypothetical protein LBC13_02345, partial [Clostridiales bacterium]|nr:hypothetical protein [Clostridiales bacterium]
MSDFLNSEENTENPPAKTKTADSTPGRETSVVKARRPARQKTNGEGIAGGYMQSEADGHARIGAYGSSEARRPARRKADGEEIADDSIQSEADGYSADKTYKMQCSARQKVSGEETA